MLGSSGWGSDAEVFVLGVLALGLLVVLVTLDLGALFLLGREGVSDAVDLDPMPEPDAADLVMRELMASGSCPRALGFELEQEIF